MKSKSTGNDPARGVWQSGARGGSKLRDPSTPCPQIQIDLSAMLDGELEPASVRRVLVHADECPSCGGFLEGIRMQLEAHRELAEAGVVAGATETLGAAAAAFREELERSRRQLARILYELGRTYVLMGLSPSFTRDVAKEPVPITDACARGRMLLDEVVRSATGNVGSEWLRAKALFQDGEIRSPAENVKQGKRLLGETLVLAPDYHEARILLGHAYHVCEQHEQAKQQFRAVLAATEDLVMRAFALENLGIVYLDEGRPAASIPHFLMLVDSGVIRHQPRFFSTYFNLALAHGVLKRFPECRHWLARLYREFPHKRRRVGEQLRARAQFANTLGECPAVERSFAREFDGWFPISGGGR